MHQIHCLLPPKCLEATVPNLVYLTMPPHPDRFGMILMDSSQPLISKTSTVYGYSLLWHHQHVQ